MSDTPQVSEPQTAAILVIGDEVLSGRTQDLNVQAIAAFLAPFGVAVREARVVGDEIAEIAAAVNALRARYSYVFTTGGIGPTHDDRTADAMGEAFGVKVDIRADARAILEAHYGRTDLNEARLRMARIPDGASLIANPVSKAPGFQLGNVFVMAGVPSIVRAMLVDVGPRLCAGAPLLARALRGLGAKEGDLAAPLRALAERRGDLSFGSYPFYGADGFGVSIVARGREAAALEAAVDEIKAIFDGLGVAAEDLGAG